MVNILRAKLTKRYFILTLVIIFLTLAVLYGITIRVMTTSFHSQIEYRDELIARSLNKRIDFMIKNMIYDMRSFSPFVLKTAEHDRLFYLSEMENMVAREPLYLFIQVFDQEGKLLERIPDIDFKQPLYIDPIHRRLEWSKTTYISNVRTLPNGKKAIAVAYPTLDEEENYRGGIVAFINLDVFSEFLKELKIGEAGISTVVDRDGVIIAHSNKKLVGQPMGDHHLAKELYKERYGTWIGDLFNQKMIVAFRPLSGGFGLIVGEPLNQATETTNQVALLLLKGFGFVLLIAILLSVIGASRVVKPIMGLISQAQQYRENRRERFDPIKTKDELEDLAFVMGQMAQELTEKERRLFFILESIPYGVITTDRQGKITTFNKGAEELTLFTREEAVGQYIFHLPLKENKNEFISWQTVQEGKEFNDVESYLFDKNKERHDVRMYSSQLLGKDDKVMGIILVIRDVSEIKKLEEYVERSERLAALGQLTAGIAHEIKNPLSIIQAAAESIHIELENRPESKLIYDLTEDILETSDRMNHLLSHFLRLSKGDEHEEKSSVDLVMIIGELLHLLRKQLNDKGIVVHQDDTASEALVYGHKNGLTQVFLNIILNSIQAMEDGGTLVVRIEELPHDWVVEVKDTGKGIPVEKVPRLFIPFYSTKREGTGLGLTLAHSIIVRHDGKIMAASNDGKGTTLIVRLPKMTREGIPDENNFDSR